MSRSASSSSTSSRFKLTVELEGATNVAKWRASLQSKLFRCIKNTNMDTLTAASTLDPKYFKANFSSDWKEASHDDDNKAVELFDDDDFVQACLNHALESGDGFHDWLYGRVRWH